MPTWPYNGINYSWDQIIMKLGNGHWSLDQACKVTAMPKKNFLMRVIMTGSQQRGTPIGNAANLAIKNIKIQRGIQTGKVIDKTIKVKRALNIGKALDKTLKISRFTKLTQKIGQKTIIKQVGKTAGRAAGRSILRSIGIKIVGGFIVGATVVGTFFFTGSLIYDGYQIYKGLNQPLAQDQVADSTVAEGNSDVKIYKLYKNLSSISQDNPEQDVFKLIGNIEFQIDDNGKVLADYQKTEKDVFLINAKSKVDLIKDYSGEGSFNSETKELSLELRGETELKRSTENNLTYEIMIKAKGNFNGNNFNLNDFTGKSRLSTKNFRLNEEGFYEAPNGHIEPTDSFKWSKEQRLAGWKAVTVDN